MKIIGITTHIIEAFEMSNNKSRGRLDQSVMLATSDYATSIAKAGGLPLLIPVINDVALLENTIMSIDGLLLSGGGDVNPRLYDQSQKKGLGKLEVKRDHVEMKLIELAIKHKKPIFGVCRGLQLLNVYFGGTLIQDIHNYFETEIEHAGKQGPKDISVHNIDVINESSVNKALNNIKNSNSYHHQCIEILGDELIPLCVSDDHIIEAFEHSCLDNIVAVQWHPEMMAETDDAQFMIFKDFVNSCGQRRE